LHISRSKEPCHPKRITFSNVFKHVRAQSATTQHNAKLHIYRNRAALLPQRQSDEGEWCGSVVLGVEHAEGLLACESKLLEPGGRNGYTRVL
jgi:hypothetical protein